MKVVELLQSVDVVTRTAPDAKAMHGVLHELGRALVSAGEPERALAVLLELQAEAPGRQDVTLQIQGLKLRSTAR